jgi:hypothetical protein
MTIPKRGTNINPAPDGRMTLIDFLDGLEADPDLEPTLGNEFVPGSDECEIPEDAEPSLGSFDRMIDQEKSWRTCGRNPDLYGWSSGSDNELDDSDHEDDDPAEEGEASGIGDYDGLLDQVGSQDCHAEGRADGSEQNRRCRARDFHDGFGPA